jgi:HNH endonuclease
MGFSPEVAERALVACGRCCCTCHDFCGPKIELHHIKQVADGGNDTFENCIPLCFNCHSEVKSYNPQHPKGRKYTDGEVDEALQLAECARPHAAASCVDAFSYVVLKTPRLLCAKVGISGASYGVYKNQKFRRFLLEDGVNNACGVELTSIREYRLGSVQPGGVLQDKSKSVGHPVQEIRVGHCLHDVYEPSSPPGTSVGHGWKRPSPIRVSSLCRPFTARSWRIGSRLCCYGRTDR